MNTDARVKAHGQPWPKLSEDLHGPRNAWHCQKCGRSVEDLEASLVPNEHLTIWQEHDETDTPVDVYVALCSTCDQKGSKKTLIERHARLYSPAPRHLNRPGLMHLCRECLHRAGWDCQHPDLKKNGGPGLEVIAAKPMVTFIDGSRGGRRFGEVYQTYQPAKSCAGQMLRPDDLNTESAGKP